MPVILTDTMSCGPIVQVHSDSKTIFSFTKPSSLDSGSEKTSSLASALRETQIQVNLFLTELIAKIDGQEQSQGDDAGSDEDEDEDDEEDEDLKKISSNSKRKTDGNSSNGASKDLAQVTKKRIKL